jgi:hypothetical protein
MNATAPHNIEAEQTLLGTILVNNEALYRVSDFLEPKHFFEPAHRRIFERAGELIRSGKLANPITLQNSLPDDLDVYGFTGTCNKYLTHLAAEATTIINAEDYGRIVHDVAIRRQVVAICEEAIENAQHMRVDCDPHEQIDDCTTKLRLLAEDDDRLSRRRTPQWIDMSNWDNEPVPERQWAIRDRVPANQAGLFSGEGGTGKSIIELTKNVAHVTGKDWFGSLPEPGPAFYLGAEDDDDSYSRRAGGGLALRDSPCCHLRRRRRRLLGLRMSGRRSRDKGARTERALVRLLQGQGIAAAKISRAWCAGADLRVPLLGVDRAVEVKCRAAGFRQFYDWLKQRDVLIVKADRQEPLVVLRMSLAAEIAKSAGRGVSHAHP